MIIVAINDGYLDFVQTHGLISLVNDNHMDNNLKEILAYVYHGSVVNNQSKKHPQIVQAFISN